jgi:hypothetical protein
MSCCIAYRIYTGSKMAMQYHTTVKHTGPPLPLSTPESTCVYPVTITQTPPDPQAAVSASWSPYDRRAGHYQKGVFGVPKLVNQVLFSFYCIKSFYWSLGSEK